jgi:hypothetical protein
LKYAAILLFTLLVTSTAAFAQGRIDLFADQAMTQCSLVDNGQVVSVFVIWSGPESADGVFFSAPRPACWQGATWVGDGLPGYRGRDGNSQTGLFVTLYPPGQYEGCKKPPVLVCTIYFFTSGTAQPCCDLKVVGVPLALEPYPLEYYCLGTGAYPGPASAGNKVVINPDSSCPCNSPVAVEPTTWGRVKSLYR